MNSNLDKILMEILDEMQAKSREAAAAADPVYVTVLPGTRDERTLKGAGAIAIMYGEVETAVWMHGHFNALALIPAIVSVCKEHFRNPFARDFLLHELNSMFEEVQIDN